MAVVYGMLAGMAINTAIVSLAAARAGYPLLPSLEVGDLPLRDVLGRYAALGAAALFAAGTVPLNFAFAGMLGADAVPAWAFASKLVQVFTTTVGFAIGAVVLPHLGSLVAARSRAQLRDDTVFLLVIGAWVSALCALAVDALAEPVAVALLAGDRISAAQASQLAEILRIGALQLPFVVSGAVLAKVAAVAGGSWRATMAAAVGFAVNLGANLMLVPILGVEGVAFASTAGAGMASVTMLLLARRRADLAFRDVVLVCGLWAGVAILGAAVTARSLAIALVSVVVLATVARMQWVGFAGREEAAR
jgi:peptidoglycan biosynthesis protein MviN/MurJ (putative lipid II flippase)